MKVIYLRCQYETHLFPGDFSNGVFYDGMLTLADEAIADFFNEFLETKKVTMYPHAKNINWSEPIFEDELKELDYNKDNIVVTGDKSFTESSPSGYKYHRWFEVLEMPEKEQDGVLAILE